jgi:hypothetical protein
MILMRSLKVVRVGINKLRYVHTYSNAPRLKADPFQWIATFTSVGMRQI